MVTVKFIKENFSVRVKRNTLLLDAIREANLNIETPCNGMGFCGKCRVIARGELSKPSEREKSCVDVNNGERLSCMAFVLGDVEVELIEKEKILKTINKGFSINVLTDSPVKKVKIIPINRKSTVPYANYLGYRFNSINIFRKICSAEVKNPETLWGISLGENLLDITDKDKDIFGVAVDIGTTGVSYYLINLSDGIIINKLSALNPQTQYGGDVLSRISYCMENPTGHFTLQKLIVNNINESITHLVKGACSVEDIYHIAVAANTTMMHLLLGISPEPLSKAPYRSVFLSIDDIKARDISIAANDEAILSIVPSASSYVGGDIVSGIMSSGFQEHDRSVFIDIGTNGEMAVLKDGKIICTSTAAGPALEGMNIECGCRAQSGAIERFDIDENYNIVLSTIGDEKAVGICGSGLIDIAGSLVKRNILLESGRWNKNLDSRIAEKLVDNKFFITEDIYISQKDIRQIQLAKGAIAAGVILMLEEIGLNIESINKVFIAGAFGYHVNPDNIRIIGLIPKGFTGNIEFLGNTSLEGARLMLISQQCYKSVNDIKDKMEVLELSLRENFQDIFVSQLNF